MRRRRGRGSRSESGIISDRSECLKGMGLPLFPPLAVGYVVLPDHLVAALRRLVPSPSWRLFVGSMVDVTENPRLVRPLMSTIFTVEDEALSEYYLPLVYGVHIVSGYVFYSSVIATRPQCLILNKRTSISVHSVI